MTGELFAELETELKRVASQEVEYTDGDLHIHILLDEATRLPASASKGRNLPCPYMVITGGRAPVRSSVQENSKSPLWNEQLKVEIRSIPCVLKCELWDSACTTSANSRPAEDKSLGHFEVVITNDFFVGGGYRHSWHQLQGQQQLGLAQTGKVRLAYSFTEEILRQLRSGLHPGKQRAAQLVNETWVIVEHDYKNHAKLFFEKFWEYIPADKNPFTARGLTDLDSPFMQVHSIQVLKTVGQFLISSDLAEEMKPLLASLGTLHAGLGIEDVHFLAMQTALLDTLESALGDRWDLEVRMAWTDSFSRVQDLMLPTFSGSSLSTGNDTPQTEPAESGGTVGSGLLAAAKAAKV